MKYLERQQYLEILTRHEITTNEDFPEVLLKLENEIQELRKKNERLNELVKTAWEQGSKCEVFYPYTFDNFKSLHNLKELGIGK